MSAPENGQCPLFGLSRKKFISNYHGSFLSCKDLLQCQSTLYIAKVLGIIGRDSGYTGTVADACVIIPMQSPDMTCRGMASWSLAYPGNRSTNYGYV
jgi:hypothetical protein